MRGATRPTFQACPVASVKAIREQTLSNIREAIELYLEPVEDDLTPSPDTEITEIAV